MRRNLLVAIFFLLLATSALAQESSNQNELTEKNWNDLFAALDGDQWIVAADSATKYLKQLKAEDKDHSLARLRYILIFASAGKVTQRQMTYPELDKVLTDLLGKDIMTPFRRLDPCEGGPGPSERFAFARRELPGRRPTEPELTFMPSNTRFWRNHSTPRSTKTSMARCTDCSEDFNSIRTSRRFGL